MCSSVRRRGRGRHHVSIFTDSATWSPTMKAVSLMLPPHAHMCSDEQLSDRIAQIGSLNEDDLFAMITNPAAGSPEYVQMVLRAIERDMSEWAKNRQVLPVGSHISAAVTCWEVNDPIDIMGQIQEVGRFLGCGIGLSMLVIASAEGPMLLRYVDSIVIDVLS